MHWLPVILLSPYLILLLKIYRALRKTKIFTVSTESSTQVSVIIACKNEQENIPGIFECIMKQDYPEQLLEIIIIDDNSNDDTFNTASRFTSINRLKVIRNNGSGKKQAVRTGINSSSGKLIITTDADCRMGTQWIKTIVAFYEKHNPDMIICPVKIEPEKNLWGIFQDLEFLSLQGITAGAALSGDAVMCNGANLSFKREVYLKHQWTLKDEIKTGDDVFLLHSLKKEIHSKIMWLESNEATVTTFATPTLSSFCKQRSRWISKILNYNDSSTIILGIVTFIAVLTELLLFALLLIDIKFLIIFTIVFIIKSVPDFLILNNTASRYEKADLIKWIIPSMIIYPMYVVCITIYSAATWRYNRN